MTEQPDDWYDDLLDRENNPEGLGRPQGIAGNLKDEAVGRAKDFASDRIKDAGKKALKQAGKSGAEAGAEAAAGGGAAAGAGAAAGGSAAAGAAAGGAAASGGAAAAGAGVAATTGVETAGIGVAVGALIAAMGSKKGRWAIVITFGILAVSWLVIVVTAVMIPVIIKETMSQSTTNPIKSVLNVRTPIMLAKMGAKGAKALGSTAVDVGKYAAGGIGKGLKKIGIGTLPGGDPTLASTVSDPARGPDGAVLAATDAGGAVAEAEDSRLITLAEAMGEQGFFSMLSTKYGLIIESDKGKSYTVKLNGKVIKTVQTEEALIKLFEENATLQELMLLITTKELHVVDYSKRITLAEKSLADYKTNQLFIPGGDNAVTKDEVKQVRKTSLETQNNPFLAAMTTELTCEPDCGSWVAERVSEDSADLTANISDTDSFSTPGTLKSKMADRIKSDAANNDTFLEWYRYVDEIKRTSELDTPEEIAASKFIQGTLKTKKDQSSRQWYHWQTSVEQFETGNLSDKTASVLFQSLKDGQSSKAYRHLGGQTGGVELKEYEKINDNQDNIVHTIYEGWKKENQKQAGIVEKALKNNILQAINNGGFSGFIASVFSGGDGNATKTEKKAVVEAGFELGSEIMIPTCDATKDGPRFMNCLYAGAEASARDMGISDYGLNGAIPEEEYQKTLGYVANVEKRVAAKAPLMERLTSMKGSQSFARTLVLQASIPIDISTSLSAFASYLAQLPSHITSLAVTSTNGTVLAAETASETKINNIDRAGITLNSLQDTPLSKTLDDPSGSLTSCPVTEENQENLCRSDETTYLALAGKFGLLPEGGQSLSFTVGSYNILNAEYFPEDSKRIGGCSTTPVTGDPDCAKTRTTRQAQIISGKAGLNPALDIVGLQEVSPAQYTQLRGQLTGYDSFPANGSRLSPGLDGNVAMFWNKQKFTKFAQGKTAAMSNTAKDVTNPWVGLQALNGQKVYITSIHYANSANGGTDAVVKRSAKLTMDWVRSKLKEETTVIVMGDFNDRLDQKLAYCIYTEDGLMQHLNDMSQGDDPGAGCASPDTPGPDHIYATPKQNVTAAGWTIMPNTGLVAQSSDHVPVYATMTFPSAGAGSEFNIATFNVLGKSHSSGDYKARMDRSINVLDQNNVDIIGFQEFQPDQRTYFKQKVGSTYELYEPTPRKGDNSIGWNKTKFALIDKGVMPGLVYFNGGKLYAPWVKLQDNRTSQQFYVLNTHDPAGPTYAKERFDDANEHHRYVTELKKQGLPIFFTGDFNSGFSLRSSGNTTYGNVARNLTYCIFTRDKTLRNAFDVFEKREVTCPNQGNDNAVDHIYLTDGPEVTKYFKIDGGKMTNGSDVHDTHIAEITIPGTGSDTGGASGTWSLPAKKSSWVSDGQRWLEPHGTGRSIAWTNGIVAAADINRGASNDDCGDDIYSMLAGTVVSSPPSPTIQIKSVINGKTVLITYAHGNNNKQSGQVGAGEKISEVGTRGNSTACHLHLEISYGGKPVCPQDVLPLVARGQSPNLDELVTKARYACR